VWNFSSQRTRASKTELTGQLDPGMVFNKIPDKKNQLLDPRDVIFVRWIHYTSEGGRRGEGRKLIQGFIQGKKFLREPVTVKRSNLSSWFSFGNSMFRT